MGGRRHVSRRQPTSSGAAASVLGCSSAVNSGPQHVVVQAAFTAFDLGRARHPAPVTSPLPAQSTHPPALALDTHGNVIGGVRTPAVDVPVSTLSGAAPAGTSAICSLFGSTAPFTPQTLATLYRSKARYSRSTARTSIVRSRRATSCRPSERPS